MSLTDVIKVGDVATGTYVIEREHAEPGFTGLRIPTSVFVDCMEHVTSKFMEKDMVDGHATVGYVVDFEHNLWPEIGTKIDISTEVVKVDDKKAAFAFTVMGSDDGAVIGCGTHLRALIKV